MMQTRSIHRALLLPLLALAGTTGAAEPERDPTQPPPSAVPRAPREAASAAAQDASPRHVMRIGERRYVIDRGQRLGVGDRLGEARIERIDDGAVWLREGGVLRQVSLYGGIVKRTPATADEPPSNARPSKTWKPS